MIFRFGDFLLNPATRELSRGGAPVALPARAFDCLVYLVENRDRAVGRDELIAAVWGRTEVSDALLGHTLVKLRRGLGDSGDAQRTVRTVPRFGYRWDMETHAETEPAPRADAPPAVPGAATPASPAGSTGWLARDRRRRPAAIVLAIALVLILLAWWTLRPREASAPPTGAVPAASHDANKPAAEAALPALVLPAEVDAGEEWQWLRLGLMDLVAHRLRDGHLPTVSSESVVGLLRERSHDDGAALLQDPALAQVAALRVLPRAAFVDGRWQVQLDARGSQRTVSAGATADSAMEAARAAADDLLQKYGHAAKRGGGERVPGLDELLQRSGAAMLADQLEEARSVIEQAPPALREQPEIEQRLAQIDLRAGDYAAVEARLLPLLDRLGHGRDEALRARAMITLAAAHVRQNRIARTEELYEEAIAIGRAQDDRVVLGVALLGRGAVLAQKRAFDEAREELARARIELATVGDALGIANVDVNLGEIELMRRRPADALAVLRSAAREFEQLGAREGRAYTLPLQVAAELELLDNEAALATSERLWPPEAHTSNRRIRWSLVLARAAALAANGRRGEAWRLLDHVAAQADPARDRLARAGADLLAARMAEQAGDAMAALARLGSALGPAFCAAESVACLRGRVQRIRLLAATGRADAAWEALAAIDPGAEPGTAGQWQRMQATLARAEVDRAQGHQAEALEGYAAAMAIAEELGIPEDLVAVATARIAALVEAGQLDIAQVASGRIGLWAARDLRAAQAQARLFRALGESDAAVRAEAVVAALESDAGPPPRGEQEPPGKE
ncbi:MAG: transcriptional regulator [Xanthomonadales bacterium]|nr:transcriptional regulator [Xanthomonadales bacterium]